MGSVVTKVWDFSPSTMHLFTHSIITNKNIGNSFFGAILFQKRIFDSQFFQITITPLTDGFYCKTKQKCPFINLNYVARKLWIVHLNKSTT